MWGRNDLLITVPDAEVVTQVVPAAELRYFDEFADAIAEAIIERSPVRTGARHDKVPHCVNSYEDIDSHHRPIESSRWFWLNRICIRKQPRTSLQLGKSRKWEVTQCQPRQTTN